MGEVRRSKCLAYIAGRSPHVVKMQLILALEATDDTLLSGWLTRKQNKRERLPGPLRRPLARPHVRPPSWGNLWKNQLPKSKATRSAACVARCQKSGVYSHVPNGRNMRWSAGGWTNGTALVQDRPTAFGKLQPAQRQSRAERG
jgi:hypothetical protein